VHWLWALFLPLDRAGRQVQRYRCLACGQDHWSHQNGPFHQPGKNSGRVAWRARGLRRHRCSNPLASQGHLAHLFDFGTAVFTSSQGALWGLVIAIVSVIGDLIASVLKRLAGMKDSGGAIPGIGGLLDLTDSLILSAPTGYFIILLL